VHRASVIATSSIVETATARRDVAATGPAPKNAPSLARVAARPCVVGRARPPGHTPTGIEERRGPAMARAQLTISSRNYSSWCLRGWLLCKFAGLEFEVVKVPVDDASARAELLLLSPSFLTPCLTCDGIEVWDTLAIAEFLHESLPAAGLLPAERAERTRCRSICGEMHSGFMNLRAALPMNLKARHPGFKIWSGALMDIDRVCVIWRDALARSGGPFLFGARTMADAMYAPVCTRLATYDVALDPISAGYRDHVLALPEMREWTAAALQEPDEVEELEVEF
jgi:glutathione S-transferase